MAKKKKGPRQAVGLQCTVCKHQNYITEYNKNNEQLKKQAGKEPTFPKLKYCKHCKKKTKHRQMKKLK